MSVRHSYFTTHRFLLSDVCVLHISA